MSEASPSASPAGRGSRAPRAREPLCLNVQSSGSSFRRALVELDDSVDILSCAKAAEPGASDRAFPKVPHRHLLDRRAPQATESLRADRHSAHHDPAVPRTRRSRIRLRIRREADRCSARRKILAVLLRHLHPLAINVQSEPPSLRARIAASVRLFRSTSTTRPKQNVGCSSRTSPRFILHFSHLRWLLRDAQRTPPSPRESCLRDRLDSANSARAHREMPQRAPSASPLSLDRRITRAAESLRAVHRSSNQKPHDLADAARVGLCELQERRDGTGEGVG